MCIKFLVIEHPLLVTLAITPENQLRSISVAEECFPVMKFILLPMVVST